LQHFVLLLKQAQLAFRIGFDRPEISGDRQPKRQASTHSKRGCSAVLHGEDSATDMPRAGNLASISHIFNPRRAGEWKRGGTFRHSPFLAPYWGRDSKNNGKRLFLQENPGTWRQSGFRAGQTSDAKDSLNSMPGTATENTPHKSENITWSSGKVTADQRERQNGHAGYVIWFTGLSAAGKSTIAMELERELFARGKHAYVLDGDNMRHGLCSDLGFAPEDRKENIRRIGEVARLFADAGFLCITAFISPYRSDRELARRIAPAGKFIEVYLNTPLAVCEQRDPKGLYAKARTGAIKDFTGISAPYEPPVNPELELRTDQLAVGDCIAAILQRLGLK
jgi:adenylyl-sulfate kinase